MRKKLITMEVTVSVPASMTPREARREVRTLINQQINYSADERDIRAKSVRGLVRTERRRDGVFAGMTPDNLVVNGRDLDRHIDAAMEAGDE